MILHLLLRPSTYIKLAIAGTSLAIVLGFFGFIHPLFDTIAHSRLHFSMALIVAFIVMALTRHFKSAVIALIFSGVGLFFAASGLPISNAKPEINDRPVYSMFHLNLLFNNKEQRRTIDLINELNPDLISFTEASILWDEMLYQLIENWPHVYHCPEFNKRGGVKIYSKWPIIKDTTYCGEHGSLALAEIILPNGVEFTVGSAHIRWPWPASGPRQIENAKPALQALRNRLYIQREANSTADKFNTSKANALIMGDFNATTWSYYLHKFANYAGLNVMNGIGPSWMFRELPEWLIPVIGLPIDQAMHNDGIHVVEAKSLPAVGSDHLPVLVRFQFKPFSLEK